MGFTKRLLICILACFMLIRTGSAAYESIYAYDEARLNVWFIALPGETHTGESILIRTPSGDWLLFDGGTAEAGDTVVSVLQQLGAERLSAVFATHMHVDHVGGLPAVIRRYAPQHIYASPFTDYHTTPTANLKSAAADSGLKLEKLLAGDKLEYGDVTLDVLWPDSEPVPYDKKRITEGFVNDSSLVIRVGYHDISILLCGDITQFADRKLVQRYGEALQADVIKVPHHGSPDASSGAFVKAVRARHSVICCYAVNDWGIYNRYKKQGNPPMITSLDGTILLGVDGKSIIVTTENERTF